MCSAKQQSKTKALWLGLFIYLIFILVAQAQTSALSLQQLLSELVKYEWKLSQGTAVEEDIQTKVGLDQQLLAEQSRLIQTQLDAYMTSTTANTQLQTDHMENCQTAERLNECRRRGMRQALIKLLHQKQVNIPYAPEEAGNLTISQQAKVAYSAVVTIKTREDESIYWLFQVSGKLEETASAAQVEAEKSAITKSIISHTNELKSALQLAYAQKMVKEQANPEQTKRKKRIIGSF